MSTEVSTRLKVGVIGLLKGPGQCSMNVRVKGVDVDMEIKNHGVELEVQDAGGTFLGNVILTKTQVIWCSGYTSREHGKKLGWEAFARLMDAKGVR